MYHIKLNQAAVSQGEHTLQQAPTSAFHQAWGFLSEGMLQLSIAEAAYLTATARDTNQRSQIHSSGQMDRKRFFLKHRLNSRGILYYRRGKAGTNENITFPGVIQYYQSNF